MHLRVQGSLGRKFARVQTRHSEGGSPEAIVAAAERLFLERNFGAVGMDDLVR
jgi:AcrR family transcriptional regulator